MVCVLGFVTVSYADNEHSGDRPSNEITRENIDDFLNSSDPKERTRAIEEVFSLYYHKGVKVNEAVPVLIEELENIDWEHLTHGSGEYGGELIYILGEFGDKRAIPAMLKSLGHAGGVVTIEAFAKMGPDILEPLIKRKEKGGKYAKLDALICLGRIPGQMKEYGYDLTPQHKSKIKDALRKSLSQEDNDIRERAVQSIGEVHGIYTYEEIKDLLPVLKNISEKDNHVLKKRKDDKKVYPVREEALKVLNMLKEKMKEKKISK